MASKVWMLTHWVDNNEGGFEIADVKLFSTFDKAVRGIEGKIEISVVEGPIYSLTTDHPYDYKWTIHEETVDGRN